MLCVACKLWSKPVLRLSRGKAPISSFLRTNKQKLETELENLKLGEDMLDDLIKSCTQQLFEMTDDKENAAYPFTSDPAQ